jgi:hypothetical protein
MPIRRKVTKKKATKKRAVRKVAKKRAVRKVAKKRAVRKVAKRRAVRDQESMGSWDGKEQYWPNFPWPWELSFAERGRFGDVYVGEWAFMDNVKIQGSSVHLAVYVAVDAERYINSSGKSPLTYTVSGAGREFKGSVKKPQDLIGVFKKAVVWAKDLYRKLGQRIEKLSNARWDVEFQGASAMADYKGPVPEFSDAYMGITFDEPIDALVLGKHQEATIDFAEGADYTGAIGEQSFSRRYRSLQDMKKIISDADKLWRKWSSAREI